MWTLIYTPAKFSAQVIPCQGPHMRTKEFPDDSSPQPSHSPSLCTFPDVAPDSMEQRKFSPLYPVLVLSH